MSMLYGNVKTWSEMIPEEQKIYLIVMGILVLALIVCIIYEYFKKRKTKLFGLTCCFCRIL